MARGRFTTAIPPGFDFYLSLQFMDTSHQDILRRYKVRVWLEAALDVEGLSGAEITVRVVDENESQMLNLSHRKKDAPTNVLTFDYERKPMLRADIVLCAAVIEQEAEQQGKSLEAHYAHMLVHGMLHAQGLDHEEDLPAKEMELHERAILTRLGFPDPYRTYK